ncbi:MAG: clostripain-related cysteine peptidase [Pyrinomonadaceae bacterium]
MKDWTVMIYMSGENNLSADMIYSIQRLRQAAADLSSINLFVYYDGAALGVPTLYCDFSDPASEFKLYRSHKIKNKLYDSAQESDENSAAMTSVANFVDWCVNKVEHKEDGKVVRGRKANRYALIFSGHSMGFQNIGLLKDEGADYHMTMKKLRWMLERLTMKSASLAAKERRWAKGRNYTVNTKSKRWKENTTPVLGQKLDILGFDSCVMGMLEVGYQFRAVAKTLIASEGSIPNAGWTYAEILGGLVGQPGQVSTNDIVKGFVRTFVRMQDRNTVGGISVDMAAWDLGSLRGIEGPFLEFVNNLSACFDGAKDGPLYTQARRLLTYVHWKCQSYMFEQNVDLGDLCYLLVEEIAAIKSEGADISHGLFDRVVESAGALVEAVRGTILIHGFSGGKYQYSNGISLFFPWSLSSYMVSKESYESLGFVSRTKCGRAWNKFLNEYVGDVSLRRSKQVGPDPVYGRVYRNYRFANEVFEDIDQSSFETPEVTGPHSDNWDSENFTTGKVPENGTDKVPENGTDKVPENGTDKVPENGTDKVPENGTDKVPENGTDKIPENGTDKIFGSSAMFFNQFRDTKNIQTFWFVSGISIDDELALEMSHVADRVFQPEGS